MPRRGKALFTILALCAIASLNLSMSAQDGTPTGKCGFQNLTIHSPAGTTASPTALNDKGAFAGFLGLGSGANFRIIGFLQQSQGTFASFNFPGARDTLVHDMNTNGLIVGSFDNLSFSGQRAFKVQNGAFHQVTIPGFPNAPAVAEGVNDSGILLVTLMAMAPTLASYCTMASSPSSLSPAHKEERSPEASIIQAWLWEPTC